MILAHVVETSLATVYLRKAIRIPVDCKNELLYD
jgi:hypothetical protein